MRLEGVEDVVEKFRLAGRQGCRIKRTRSEDQLVSEWSDSEQGLDLNRVMSSLAKTCCLGEDGFKVIFAKFPLESQMGNSKEELRLLKWNLLNLGKQALVANHKHG